MEIAFNDIKPYLRFVRYMTLDKNSHFSPWVPYDARLFYAYDGEGSIKVGKKTYVMKKNSLIFINSGVEYHLERPENTVSYIAVNFDYTFSQFDMKTLISPSSAKDYDSRRLINHITFSDATEFNEVFYLENFPSIEKRLISIEKEYARKINMYELKISSAMTDILIKCFRHSASHLSAFDGKESAKKIVIYITENFDMNLTNADIAERFNYHPNYVSSIIKQYTGLPLHQYVKNIRVNKAADMLSVTDKSIAEIGALCGFYDASHFIKTFKELIGLTPRQYRDNYQ